jgi:hypothetical protein
VKFVDPEQTHMLFLIMESGNVHCLNTITDSFLAQNSSNVVLEIDRHSVVDCKQGLLLSVNEKGYGRLNKFKIVQKGVSFEHLYRFRIAPKVSSNSVIILCSGWQNLSL